MPGTMEKIDGHKQYFFQKKIIKTRKIFSKSVNDYIGADNTSQTRYDLNW